MSNLAGGSPSQLKYRTSLLSRLVSEPDSLTQAEAQEIIAGVHAVLVRRGFTYDDAADATSVAITRFVAAGGKGRVAGLGPSSEPGGNPWNYLVTIAVNEGKTYRRRAEAQEASLETLGDRNHPSDDNIARQVDEQADAAAIRDALRVAVEKNDATVVRVITIMLDSVATTGEIPTTREMGTMLGVSHTAIVKAKVRFRGYLDSF